MRAYQLIQINNKTKKNIYYMYMDHIVTKNEYYSFLGKNWQLIFSDH